MHATRPRDTHWRWRGCKERLTCAKQTVYYENANTGYYRQIVGFKPFSVEGLTLWQAANSFHNASATACML